MDYSIDKILLQGLRDNDDAAFKYLYQTSFIAIHSIATNSSRNKEDGEDLYNDGIIVLLDKIKKPDFVLTGKIQGLLYAICKKMNSNSMRTNLKLSDAAKLERFQLALTNATTDAEIAESISKYGLSAESLEEGKTLLAKTREAYELANSPRRKRVVVYDEFYEKKIALNKLYAKHS